MIRDIFENKSNPFYKFGKQIVLREIEYEKIKKFVAERFYSQDLNILQIIEKILKITNGHPYYTQQLCHEIFVVADKKILTDEFIEKAIFNILSNHNLDYQKWWNELDNTERKILIGLCNEEKNPTSGTFISNYGIKSTSTAGSAVKRLQENGILIKRNGDSYSIEDPFWIRWIILNRK